MKDFPEKRKDDKITRILVVNDDGIGSLGLECLVKGLSALPDTEVYVSVPAFQQSGMSQSILLSRKIRVTEVKLAGAKKAITVESTPADGCLFGLDFYAHRGIYPDVVVSGINHGFNTAEDILYSGTVGAATEGALDGLPSIAVSTERFPRVNRDYIESDFDSAVLACKKMIPYAIKAGNDCIFNINVANIPPEAVRGWKITETGHIGYDLEFLEEPVATGAYDCYYKPLGRDFPGEDRFPGTDTAALNDGYVSMSILRKNRTDYDRMPEYKELVKDWKLE